MATHTFKYRGTFCSPTRNTCFPAPWRIPERMIVSRDGLARKDVRQTNASRDTEGNRQQLRLSQRCASCNLEPSHPSMYELTRDSTIVQSSAFRGALIKRRARSRKMTARVASVIRTMNAAARAGPLSSLMCACWYANACSSPTVEEEDDDMRSKSATQGRSTPRKR